MAESPLLKLGRLVGGVVLMQGRLGHQVLGQMLVMNSNEVAMAAAAVVLAATTGQRSAVGQMALRTVAPALAARVLLQKQERRIDRKEAIIAARELKLLQRERSSAARERSSQQRERSTVDRLRALSELERDVQARQIALEAEHRDRLNELERLAAELRALPPAAPDTPEPVEPAPARRAARRPRAKGDATKTRERQPRKGGKKR